MIPQTDIKPYPFWMSWRVLKDTDANGSMTLEVRWRSEPGDPTTEATTVVETDNDCDGMHLRLVSGPDLGEDEAMEVAAEATLYQCGCVGYCVRRHLNYFEAA